MPGHEVLFLVTQARGFAESYALDVNGEMDDAVLHLRLAERALKSASVPISAVVHPGALRAGEDRMYRDLDTGSRALASVEFAITPLGLVVLDEDRQMSAALEVDTGLVIDHLTRARRVFEDWIADATELGGGQILDDGLDDSTPSLATQRR